VQQVQSQTLATALAFSFRFLMRSCAQLLASIFPLQVRMQWVLRSFRRLLLMLRLQLQLLKRLLLKKGFVRSDGAMFL
jgi:hypothetical protein